MYYVYPKIPYLSIYTVKSMVLINRTSNDLNQTKVTGYFELSKQVFLNSNINFVYFDRVKLPFFYLSFNVVKGSIYKNYTLV